MLERWDKNNKCDNCQAYDDFGSKNNPHCRGLCRKGTPIIYNGDTCWPVVKYDDWCLKHRAIWRD